jgi:hypothetical protein
LQSSSFWSQGILGVKLSLVSFILYFFCDRSINYLWDTFGMSQ